MDTQTPGPERATTAHLPREKTGRPLLFALVALAMVALLVLAGWIAWRLLGPGAERGRIEAAARYVRASVEADFDALSDVVPEASRPTVAALAARSIDAGTSEVVSERWSGGSVTLVIRVGLGESTITLSEPDADRPDDVIVHARGDAGTATGTITIVEQDGAWVVTAVDGVPIDDVLAGAVSRF